MLKHAEIAGWRHRDISPGNVMIYSGRGFVIDWELAQRTNLLNLRNARMPDHTGTWHFMSACRLQNPWTEHLAMDDMESVFWLFLWLALRYGNHELGSVTLSSKLQSIFDEVIMIEGYVPTGGIAKTNLMRDIDPASAMPTMFNPPALNSVLKSMQREFHLRYMDPKTPFFSPLDNDEDRAETEREFHESVAKRDKALEYLKDPTRLRELIKSFWEYDWTTNDSMAIKHVLPLKRTGAAGPSAVKRSTSNRSGAFKSGSYPFGPLPTSASGTWTVAQADSDKDEQDRPSKKQRAAGMQLQGVELDKACVQRQGDDPDSDAMGDVMDVDTHVNLDLGQWGLQAADDGTGQSSDGDMLDRVEEEEVEALTDPGGSDGVSVGDSEASGSRSEDKAPPPPPSAAPSSPSSEWDNF